MTSQVKTHTAKDAVWTNAANDKVPYKFINHAERLKEVNSKKIHKAAIAVEQSLQELHATMTECITAIMEAVKTEYQLKKGKKKEESKGNFTWYNYNGSIKVESKINEIVKWDGELMREALRLLNEFIGKNMGEANALIAKLVTAAFSNSKGMIDSSKVFQLLSYREQIKNAAFQKACELMTDAQSIDKTKLYMMVWERMEDGSYRNISLNFSSI